MKDQEIEVKFYIANLPALEKRLLENGAVLVQARVHETNLRFDTPGRELSNQFRVLRLRQDTQARMTYKSPRDSIGGTRVRQEIEFTVEDFEAAKALLEALGYQVSMAYEKYRTTYDLEDVYVTLDELPYGNFAELEGPHPEAIRAVNARLKLDWEARSPESYTVLFERLRVVYGLQFRDLLFENFVQLQVRPEDMIAPRAESPR